MTTDDAAMPMTEARLLDIKRRAGGLSHWLAPVALDLVDALRAERATVVRLRDAVAELFARTPADCADAEGIMNAALGCGDGSESVKGGES